MTKHTTSTTDARHVPENGDTPKGAAWAVLVGAVGFLGLYLATDFVVSGLASSALPLPNDPVRQVRQWYADNQLAAVAMGVTQLVSVGFLAAVAIALPRATRMDPAATTRARIWGLTAVALMALSSALGWTLAGVADGATLDTTSALRTANFVAGGTAHVVALGAFVWLASRAPGFGRVVRGLAVAAALVSILSLSSLVWFYGSAFILLGRLLCMLWAVSAGVSLLRRRESPVPPEDPGAAA